MPSDRRAAGLGYGAFAAALLRFPVDRCGVPVPAVSSVLGHSQPSITLDVYTHLWLGSDDLVRDALVNRGRVAGFLRDLGSRDSGAGAAD